MSGSYNTFHELFFLILLNHFDLFNSLNPDRFLYLFLASNNLKFNFLIVLYCFQMDGFTYHLNFFFNFIKVYNFFCTQIKQSFHHSHQYYLNINDK